MELGLDGKVVIVTGGSSNIGRAITLAFAREKAKVAIADIDQAQGEKVAEEVRKLGGTAMVVKTDVTALAQVEGMVNEVIQKLGRVDVLVNNVGWDKLFLFVETTPDFWEKIINLNYRGVLNCTKAVLPHMVGRGSGVIVSVGSDAGRIGEQREAVYAGCKGATIAFTKSVAREVGRNGVRLNVVCPGMTPGKAEQVGSSSMWTGREVPADRLEKIAAVYPLKRVGKAEDVANAVVFLASDAASFVTGQTLSVSGGYSMA